jgi:hypothetical protein
MDIIDLTGSDRSNDIQQAVQSILVALGIDLRAEGVLDMLLEKGMLNVPAVAEGAMEPKIDYIYAPLQSGTGENFSDYLESSMNIVLGIPDRKTSSSGGGDTGDAVYMRDGWMDVDLVANFKEGFFIEADRIAINAILYLLQTNGDIDKNLKAYEIEIKFSRNKTSNIQSKSQALQTFLAAGVHPLDAVEWCDLTTDVVSVVNRMLEWKDETQQAAIEFAKQQQEALGTSNGEGTSASEQAGQTNPQQEDKNGTD